jgi:hypothetical protein
MIVSADESRADSIESRADRARRRGAGFCAFLVFAPNFSKLNFGSWCDTDLFALPPKQHVNPSSRIGRNTATSRHHTVSFQNRLRRESLSIDTVRARPWCILQSTPLRLLSLHWR